MKRNRIRPQENPRKGNSQVRAQGFLFLFATCFFVLSLATLYARYSGAEEAAPRTGATLYTLQDGDRLYHLSKRFKVSVDAILEANKVADARGLRAGQELVIPAPGTKASKTQKQRPETYRVQKGDTLTNISRRFGVSIDTILEANGMGRPQEMQAGQVLSIPAPGVKGVKGVKNSKARSAVESKQGRTKAKSKSKRATKAEPAWMRRARKLAKRLGLGTRRVAQRVLRGDLDPRWIRAAGKGRMPAILRFPVVGGWTGRGWGSGPGGYHRAVDMPGRIGARVNAAAPGIVAYANSELAGFGKVVIIIHPGGLATLYAHNSEFKTVPGERVKRGTRVALLGSSGISRGPHVHFELLYKGQLCDPLPLFRPVAKNKAGRRMLKQRELRNWPRRGGPPKGLRCGHRRRHPEYVGKPYGWRPADWATRHRKKTGASRNNAKKATPHTEKSTPHPDPELDSE